MECRPGRWRQSVNSCGFYLRAFWRVCGSVVLAWVSAVALLASTAQLRADNSGNPRQTASRQLLKVIPRHEGNVIRFYVENHEAADVTATFDLVLANLKGSASFPLTRTFAPHQTNAVFELAPIRVDQEWHYDLTNYYTLGSSQAVHDDRCVYDLPYGPERPFTVSQGYNGHFSHTGPEQFAIDWAMPEGTPVRAARGGRVVAVKDDSEIGGATKSFQGFANYILIQHSDGTMGNYAHLRGHGAKVKPGQVVVAGELLGISGNTGFSSGPHLHFSVFKTRNGQERVSLPICFRLASGAAATLLEGQVYPAPTAAKPVAERSPN